MGMIPLVTPIAGITKILDYIKGFFNVIGEWYNNLPIITLWEDLLPSDIASVIQVFIVLMITLAILGTIRKFLVIFG